MQWIILSEIVCHMLLYRLLNYACQAQIPVPAAESKLNNEITWLKKVRVSHTFDIATSPLIKIIQLITLLPVWEQSTVMNMSVSLSVCPRAYLKNHAPKLTKFFVHVACSHWQHYNMLCTCGFVNDVTFSYYRSISGVLLLRQNCVETNARLHGVDCILSQMMGGTKTRWIVKTYR